MYLTRPKFLYFIAGVGLITGASIALLFTRTPEDTVFHAHLQDWYPINPITLAATITELTQKARTEYLASLSPRQIHKPIRALIVPHAGYTYSGDIAAAAYQLLSTINGNALSITNDSASTNKQSSPLFQHAAFKRIIVLAPAHRDSFTGIALPTFTAYTTPLGDVIIDHASVQTLSKKPLFKYRDQTYTTEHSFEVQLPFIQTFIPNTPVLPLLVGSISTEDRTNIAMALKPFIDETTLIIVSSDFTHYGASFGYTPFTDTIQTHIKSLDFGALRTIQQQDPNAFCTYVGKTGATICGKNPIAILLQLLSDNTLGNVSSHLIAYKTSAIVTGNTDESVSYASMAFTQTTPSTTSLITQANNNNFGESGAFQASRAKHDFLASHEKKALLTLARATLEHALLSTPIPTSESYATPATSAHVGAFVTLYKQGDLRGCIGRVTSNEPLYKTIADMTRAAAFDDNRFTPVTPEELSMLTISISVLTKPHPIAHYQDIVVGHHGIILTKGTHSALFLPKVATDFKWDLPTTLQQLSEKAGLDSDAWQHSDVQYQVFESIDFSEPDI